MTYERETLARLAREAGSRARDYLREARLAERQRRYAAASALCGKYHDSADYALALLDHLKRKIGGAE